MEVMMRITRLPYETPRDEARTSAILIGRGILVLVISFGLPFLLGITKLGPFIPVTAAILIYGVGEFAGLAMIFAGTWLGFHATYRLLKARERLGFAWVTIVVLPLPLFLALFVFLAITYKGP
jgi:hypothetical protein